MREGDRSQVPPASSVITPCHHPYTHLENMGHPMSARYSTVIPYRSGVVFTPLADFSPLFHSTWKTSHWCPVAEDNPSWTGRASAPLIPSTPTRPCWWVSMGPVASRVGIHPCDGVENESGGSPPQLTPPTLSPSRRRALRWHHEQLPGQRAHHLPLTGYPHPAQDRCLPPLALR